jgi:hypothetical protein
MVYATQENKAQGLAWLEKVKGAFDPATQRVRDQSVDGQLHGRTGSTSLTALQNAVEMGADTIFLLTDEAPWLSSDSNMANAMPDHIATVEKFVRSIEGTTGRSVKIYPILYDPRERPGPKPVRRGQRGIPQDDRARHRRQDPHGVIRKPMSRASPNPHVDRRFPLRHIHLALVAACASLALPFAAAQMVAGPDWMLAYSLPSQTDDSSLEGEFAIRDVLLRHIDRLSAGDHAALATFTLSGTPWNPAPLVPS